MNNNEAKKIINKLNARLTTLKANSENSYEFAIAQLKQISGLEFTKGGKLRTSQKLLSHPHIDKLLSSAGNSVPTMSSEIEYIERELAHIDRRRAKLYGTAIPKRDKHTLLTELNAKRRFDKAAITNGTSFEEMYEAWETHDLPFYMTEELIELENSINKRLGKGKKGIKTYAELDAIRQEMEEYFEQELEAASNLAENDLK